MGGAAGMQEHKTRSICPDRLSTALEPWPVPTLSPLHPFHHAVYPNFLPAKLLPSPSHPLESPPLKPIFLKPPSKTSLHLPSSLILTELHSP